MSEVGHSEKPKEISRRQALKLIGATAAAAMLGTACSIEENTQEEQKKPPQPEPTKEAYREATSGLKELYQEENMPNLENIVQATSSFMKLEPQNEQRAEQEIALVNLLAEKSTPSDILLSLQSLANINARREALNLLWQKRQNGEMSEFGFDPLTEAEIKWADDNKIDPLTFAIARDCFIPSLVLFQANPGKFLDALSEKDRQKLIDENKLPHRVPNPGIIAKLLMTETSGWTNIGTVPAINEINTKNEYFPNAVNALRAIASKYSQLIPYKDHLETLPGSKRHENALSGGAVGPQIMPDNLLHLIQWYDEANHHLDKKYPPANPFDVYTGTILAYLFIAAEFKARAAYKDEYGVHQVTVDEIVRKGYDRENPEGNKQALGKWNPNAEQIEKVRRAGESYDANF
jgi:hypothetical protein